MNPRLADKWPNKNRTTLAGCEKHGNGRRDEIWERSTSGRYALFTDFIANMVIMMNPRFTL